MHFNYFKFIILHKVQKILSKHKSLKNDYYWYKFIHSSSSTKTQACTFLEPNKYAVVSVTDYSY